MSSMLEFLSGVLHAAEPFLDWIARYGKPALIVLLALGVAGLPIPDESLMLIAGRLIAEGKWEPISTIIFALVGATCGITISYYLGYFPGSFIVKKWGHWIGLTDQRIKRAHDWFELVGKWSLVIGYFIPGLRHLTGYVAGTLRLSFWKFCLFAYGGAVLWATTFISLGYFLPL